MITPVRYEDDKLMILDQTLLPGEERYIELRTKEDVWKAINRLQVRGAPAIGVAAAYGVYVAVRDLESENFNDFARDFHGAKEYIATARPTAVNLFWALDRMERKLLAMGDGLCFEPSWEQELKYIKEELFKEAEAIRKEDEEACLAMGEHGLSLLKKGMGILTHCNAGTLATAKYGTCLAPVYLGQERGYDFKVFSDETRPLLQGARLTSWELSQAGVDVTLICDNMAASVMKQGWIDAVVVGCDRMAANGDGANKIGTSQVAILAKEYGIPFYMFVPTSTIDLATPTGGDIAIEERKGEEIYQMWYEKPMAPAGIKTYNPSFDVTDHRYITAVVTEKGIVYPPYEENLRKIVKG
ncbi:S-methyl-5-thioribose-1-phosphate isomerase [Anaerovorax odorimutans]|uniref:Methylthioribose-1-phosphate isomerase n=1 Tax=Anaerovorax odorimutans TaxID=109327 RepID=A0ABT1RTA3_9FIRM|nr:S-methyl-5-thioribose-1-phosphate isomerase [Anaerovorax odorimutans]MCQ4638436.1 S-methyl-5-thioribose-1-phosphate isomerase [Anaerovorax odorimutans]